jgi:hypothetical protein
VNNVARIFTVIDHLESLRKQATVERSHFYVNETAIKAIELLYEYAATFKQEIADPAAVYRAYEMPKER